MIFQEATDLKWHLSNLPNEPYTADLMDMYYIVMDYSMYSVKAWLCWAGFVFMRAFVSDRGTLVLLVILPIYYTLDTWNTLITGNYDGLVPMLICMSIATLIGLSVYLHDNYQIVKKSRRKTIGF